MRCDKCRVIMPNLRNPSYDTLSSGKILDYDVTLPLTQSLEQLKTNLETARGEGLMVNWIFFTNPNEFNGSLLTESEI